MQTRSFTIYVTATAGQVWQALTDAQLTRQYYFGLAVESDWRPDSVVTLRAPGPAYLAGRIVHIEPHRHLVHSISSGAEEVVGAEAWLTWQIEQSDDGTCQVTLTHDDLEPAVDPDQDDACLRLLSNLKTLLETGAVRIDGEIRR